MASPEKPKRKIGYTVKEKQKAYGKKQKLMIKKNVSQSSK